MMTLEAGKGLLVLDFLLLDSCLDLLLFRWKLGIIVFVNLQFHWNPNLVISDTLFASLTFLFLLVSVIGSMKLIDSFIFSHVSP